MKILILTEGGEEEENLNPAGEEAGTWTKTMVLVTKLKTRLYNAGQRRWSPYLTKAENAVSCVMSHCIQ